MNPELHKHAETLAEEIMKTILDPASLTTASAEPGPTMTMAVFNEAMSKFEASHRPVAIGIVCHSRYHATLIRERDTTPPPFQATFAPPMPIYRDDYQEEPILVFYDNEQLRAHLQRKEIWQEVIRIARKQKMFLPTAVDHLREGPDRFIIPSISKAEAECLFPEQPPALLMVAFNFIRNPKHLDTAHPR